MELKTDFCLDLTPINKWLTDEALVLDKPSLEFIKALYSLFGFSDSNYKNVEKVIGRSVEGIGAAVINTILINEHYRSKGSHVINVTDNVIIWHDKHGFFFNNDIDISDNIIIDTARTIGTLYIDLIEEFSNKLNKNITEKVDLTTKLISKNIESNIRYIYGSDAINTHIINSSTVNSFRNHLQRRYPIVLKDEVIIEIT
jgi:hypothetical protein